MEDGTKPEGVSKIEALGWSYRGQGLYSRGDQVQTAPEILAAQAQDGTAAPERDIEKELREHIASNCTPVDREQRFRDMLDDCYSFEKVGGPFVHMMPSRVLEECDPTAFRCGVNDYEDSEDWVEIGDCYYERSAVEEAREEFIFGLENERPSELDEENQSEIEEIDALIEAVKAVEF